MHQLLDRSEYIDRLTLLTSMGSTKFKRERAAFLFEKQTHGPRDFSALCSLGKLDFERLISQVTGSFQLDLFIQIPGQGHILIEI